MSVTTDLQIAVVGRDAHTRKVSVRALQGAGYTAVADRPSVRVDGRQELPDLVVIADAQAAALCREVRGVAGMAAVAIVAIRAGATSDRDLIHAGADGVIEPGDTAEQLAVAIEGAFGRVQDRRRLGLLSRTHDALLRIQQLMAEGGDAPDVLRDVLLIAADTLGFERASLVAHVAESGFAYVIAATDDPSLSRFTLAVSDYPELAEAIETGQAILIGDVSASEITAPVSGVLREHGVAAIGVFPVVWRGRSLGALLLRKHSPGVDHVGPALVDFARLFSHQVAAQLRDSSVFERLRDQTRRISRASYEAERRLRTVASLKAHFAASSDGVIVVDEDGGILFVNAATERMTGFASDALLDRRLADLVPPEQREPVAEIIREVLAGNNLEPFDLDLTTTGGDSLTVSCTTSTVLSRSGAAVISFRDVTAQRQLEAELQATKDFLENLINSVVDAIVAADLDGNVVLFNRGAEDLFGYKAEDVIGAIPASDLYPAGVATQVMRMLRSSAHGGVGRLDQTRREVVTQAGELVPVNMTASIIYDHGSEVATVAILSDLRERIRIEQRLLQAQEQLEMKERQAMVAGLAGAAAHELNQPLTSIIGYVQLIKRRTGAEDEHARALGVILEEAERMAEIVRKIGKITSYQTVSYVGSANIVDLDRSAASSGELPAVDAGTEEEHTERVSLADIEREISSRELDEAVGEELDLDREDRRGSDADRARESDDGTGDWRGGE